jgi:hypothetical protein
MPDGGTCLDNDAGEDESLGPWSAQRVLPVRLAAT